ncbi:MAG: isopropylmalate isomerase, partial [Gammaproteobacteria bacterium]|nr:isopropylmalate isomerase [Gammaproteobacteria bacterium]
CTVLGIPAVRAAAADIERLQELVTQNPATGVTVDLEAQMVTAGSLQCPATLPEGARHALVRGTWDSTTLLLANRDQIAATTTRLPYLGAFTN